MKEKLWKVVEFITDNPFNYAIFIAILCAIVFFTPMLWRS